MSGIGWPDVREFNHRQRFRNGIVVADWKRRCRCSFEEKLTADLQGENVYPWPGSLQKHKIDELTKRWKRKTKLRSLTRVEIHAKKEKYDNRKGSGEKMRI